MKITTAAPHTLIPCLVASQTKYGDVFKSLALGVNVGPLFMRVKPTGFLLNSSLLGDIITRGDILTVNLEKNTLYYMRGETLVRLKEVHLVVTDE